MNEKDDDGGGESDGEGVGNDDLRGGRDNNGACDEEVIRTNMR